MQKRLKPNILSILNILKQITSLEVEVPEIIRFYTPVGGTNGIMER
jgi:hypothetical protein